MPARSEKRQRLFEVAATQSGYFTAAQARALGYSPRSIVYHVGAGHFERVRRGFYRLVEFPALPHEDVVAAWVMTGPGEAIVSHDTALALYELAPSRSREIHLLVPRSRRPRRRPILPAVRIPHHHPAPGLRRGHPPVRCASHGARADDRRRGRGGRRPRRGRGSGTAGTPHGPGDCGRTPKGRGKPVRACPETHRPDHRRRNRTCGSTVAPRLSAPPSKRASEGRVVD